MNSNLGLRQVLLATALASAPVTLSAEAKATYADAVEGIMNDSLEAREWINAPMNIDLTKIDSARLLTELKRIGFPEETAGKIQTVIRDMAARNVEKLQWDAVLSGYIMNAELVRSPFIDELRKSVPGIFDEEWKTFDQLFWSESLTAQNYEAFIKKLFDKESDQKRWLDRRNQFGPEYTQKWIDFCNELYAHIQKNGYLNSIVAKQTFIAAGSTFFYWQAKPESQLRIAPNTADQISRLFQIINCKTLDPKLQVSGVKVLFGRTGKDSSSPDALKYTFFTPQALATSAVPMPTFTNDVTNKGVAGLQVQYKTYLDWLEADKWSAVADARAQNYKKLWELMDEVSSLYTIIDTDLKTLTSWTWTDQQKIFLRLAENARKMKVAQQSLDAINKPFAEEKWYKDTIELTKVTFQLLAKANIQLEK